MALIFDNIIVFLYWVVRQWIVDYRTSDWPIAIAVLDDAIPKAATLYPLVTVRYHFTVDGQKYSGQFKKGFWYSDSAQAYAESLKEARVVQIRYKHDAPDCSSLRDEDPLRPLA